MQESLRRCPHSDTMPPICPHCTRSLSETDDHRLCLMEMFKTNKIQRVSDWTKLCEEYGKPKTIMKRRIRVMVMVE